MRSCLSARRQIPIWHVISVCDAHTAPGLIFEAYGVDDNGVVTEPSNLYYVRVKYQWIVGILYVDVSARILLLLLLLWRNTSNMFIWNSSGTHVYDVMTNIIYRKLRFSLHYVGAIDNGGLVSYTFIISIYFVLLFYCYLCFRLL